MRKLIALAGLTLLVGIPSTAVAQDDWGGDPPQCDEWDTGHFLVNSAVLYVKAATEAEFDDRREGALRDARRVLNQSLQRGQADNGAVWYYYGRYYEMSDDLAGADSTYTRASELMPACAESILERRRRLWVPLVNEGIEALQAGQVDSAAAAFEKANLIYREEPEALYYLADIKARQGGQTDSAIALFKEALTLTGGEERHASIEENSLYMIARLYHIDQDLDSAVAWYNRYREVRPDDAEVVSDLASLYQQLGNAEAAFALFDTIIANPDDYSPLAVFNAGVSLFIAEDFEEAAEAFETALEYWPHYRDGLYNLANTYVALAQQTEDEAERAEYGERMLPIVERLLEVDPANQQSLRLYAQAYQLVGDRDRTLEVLEQADAQKYDVAVDIFQPLGDGTHTFSARLVNLSPDSEVTVPSVTFEFTDANGTVVTTETVDSMTLEQGAQETIQLRPAGENIVAYQYSVGE